MKKAGHMAPWLVFYFYCIATLVPGFHEPGNEAIGLCADGNFRGGDDIMTYHR